MEKKKNGRMNRIMRSLHRDIGFFVIGLTVIYSLSGLVLVYRDTDFLKKERIVEKTLPPNLSESDLGGTLHMRGFKVEKTEGDVIYFGNGTYNSKTGEVSYSIKSLPLWLDKLNKLHKISSRNFVHYGAVVFGILLLFLAVSSFWMFRAGTSHFKRGLILTGVGILFAVVLLML